MWQQVFPSCYHIISHKYVDVEQRPTRCNMQFYTMTGLLRCVLKFYSILSFIFFLFALFEHTVALSAAQSVHPGDIIYESIRLLSNIFMLNFTVLANTQWEPKTIPNAIVALCWQVGILSAVSRFPI